MAITTKTKLSEKKSLPFPLKERGKWLTNRLVDIYGDSYLDPSKTAYKIEYGVAEIKSAQGNKILQRYPFAFELIAVPKNEEMIRADPPAVKSEFFGLINSSYSALGTRFEGDYQWFDKNGNPRSDNDILDCLRSHGFVLGWHSVHSKDKIPCVIAGNLLSERVDYTEKSKSNMDTSPFVDTIIRAVGKVTAIIPTYRAIGIKIDSDSGKYRVSSKPRSSTTSIKEVVRMMLLPRIQKVKVGGTWDAEQTQDSLWYNAIPLFNKYDVKYENKSRGGFKACIREICKEYDIAREQIGIIASPWGGMYFRDMWHDISYNTIQELAKKGTDILFIEKRDIVQALGKYTSKRGIALVNTHGLLSEYTADLAELADTEGAHIAIFTDYDIPGILIASQLGKSVPRLGVDERMLKHFGIFHDNEELVIPYKPKKDRLTEENLDNLIANDERFNYDGIDIDFLKYHKIEIDAILAKVGAERLWEYLEKLLKEEFPTRDYLRVINPAPDLSKHYPPIVQQLKLYYDKKASEITKPESEKIKKQLRVVRGFIDVEKKEKEISDDRLGKIVREDKHLEEVAEAFVSLDREKGYKITDIEIVVKEASQKNEQVKSSDVEEIPDPPITEEAKEIKRHVSKWTLLDAARFLVINNYGSEEIQYEISNGEMNCVCKMEQAYKEVIREYKEKHNQQLPWEE